jgi:DNA polymerase III sliding clamp (beta) subunit (PCNA family)
MKVSLQAADLARVASIAALGADESEATHIPILACIRLTASFGDESDQGALSLYSTDLSVGIGISIDCDVDEEGDLAVNAARLVAIVRKITGKVTMQVASKGLELRAGRSRFTLPTEPVENGPEQMTVEKDSHRSLLGDADVRAVFESVAAAAAVRDPRVYLSGPMLFTETMGALGHRLCAVGTNGYALVHCATDTICDDLGDGVIVHRSTCDLAVKLFGNTGCTMHIDGRLVELDHLNDRFENARLVAKLVDARPVQWRSTVPAKDQPHIAVLDRASLIAALERCLAVAVDIAKRAPQVAVWWDAGATPGEVNFALGKSLEEAPAAIDTVSAQVTGRIEFNLNPLIALRLLLGLESETVRISAGGDSAPLRIDAGDCYAVLMPVYAPIKHLHLLEAAE